MKKIYVILLSLFVVTSLSLLFYYRAAILGYRNYTGVVDYNKSRDKAAILEIFNKNWYWLISEYTKDFSPEFMLESLSHDKTSESYGQVTIKVMLDNGKPVGFVAYYMKTFYEGFLWFLAVNEEVRNKKYGKLLMKTAIDDLTKRGARYIRLITRTTNYPAQAVYKSLGFKATHDNGKFVDFELMINHQTS